MKNTLNKISQEEKNRILEMHSGMKKTIKEQYDDRNGMNWTQNTTMDRQSPMDEPILGDDEGSLESILKKHNLLDKASVSASKSAVMFKNESSKVIQKFLSILHLLTDIRFISIMDCESADFSGVDICSLPELAFINLNGTENNFKEQGYECVSSDLSDLDDFYFIE